jgi:uncharacterized protein DUF6894
MPRYYFDLANGHRLADPSGLVCRDDEDAKAKAEVIARQIAAEAPASTGRRVTILDEGGQEITTAPIDKR